MQSVAQRFTDAVRKDSGTDGECNPAVEAAVHGQQTGFIRLMRGNGKITVRVCNSGKENIAVKRAAGSGQLCVDRAGRIPAEDALADRDTAAGIGNRCTGIREGKRAAVALNVAAAEVGDPKVACGLIVLNPQQRRGLAATAGR